MGNFTFRLPDIGEGVTEAEITAWHVAVGDTVEEDQPLADVMTDKATVELTSPVAGKVLAMRGEVGDLVPVRSTLVELETEGKAGEEPAKAEVKTEASKPANSSQAPAPAQSKPAAPAESKQVAKPTSPAGAAPLAAPATRRLAHERGIDLAHVPATGKGGIITPDDLERFAKSGSADQSARTRRTGVEEIKLTGMRRKIAERMQDAKRRIPHFTYVEEFDMTELEALRAELNAERHEDQPKLTLLPFFMQAIVQLRGEFPHVNARYDDEAGVLQVHEAVHIGIATQTDAGLMVPVVHHVEALDIWECARELTRAADAARNGTATREDLSGSTITLTSLGALGGISATPIINSPEVAIIGPNKLVQRPVVINGQVVVRTMMNLSASFDHRIIDGHQAARFVQRLKRLIERPALIFIGPR
jgi:2-oxoisovalerate dehydrogenase E2 component (dihydrolipoyl transacylase)